MPITPGDDNGHFCFQLPSVARPSPPQEAMTERHASNSETGIHCNLTNISHVRPVIPESALAKRQFYAFSPVICVMINI